MNKVEIKGKPVPPSFTAKPTPPAASPPPPVPSRRTVKPAINTGNLSAKVASHVSQTPQTVGVNPNPPPVRKVSARVDTSVPYASGYTPYL
jgi:hypothetical protein